ncbi:uncharacterized protein LOC128030720 isoform X2 [Carassius gibelio]|uniref:uncharacterized protein LOC128030720 isoform X2 n=1 Tax=Carassius gibelio TaxID=101364 RepID=UPI0022783731|nr:uncharacterized protein LOC128030720 isoform X2 [Carassius gibelio]
MIMRTSLLLALFFCFSLVEGTSLKGKTCVGVRRGDTSYDFALPDAVAVKVQDLSCDAEWSIDQFTAILEGNVAHFKHPFKKVNRTGISVAYCPFSVKFHVSCHDYAKHLTCSCTNSTSIYPVFSTTRPYGDLSSTAVETHSSVRQHYGAIAAAVSLVIILVILAFLAASTAQNAPEKQNQRFSVD